MDYTYTFGDPSTIYLNVTNRCTNQCVFCVRNYGPTLGSGHLQGHSEPDFESLLEAIELQNENIHEVVWCGFGEPTFRTDLILGVSSILQKKGIKVRLNTNGHALLINGRDILPELASILDHVSISLNAPNEERYREICRPKRSHKTMFKEEANEHWDALIDFISRSAQLIKRVDVSIVCYVLEDWEIDESRKLAFKLGCHHFRLR